MKNRYKYIIHMLVIGAVSLSWVAVGNLHNHLHSSVKLVSKKKASDEESAESNDQSTNDQPTVQPLIQAQAKKLPAAPTVPNATVPTASVKALIATIPVQKNMASNASQNKSASREVTIDKTKIDLNFIRKVEGTATKAYVPIPKKSSSGVTVGDGVDLGQLNKAELSTLPISPSLKSKLAAYIGLKKQKAVAFLRTHPLTITSTELEQLNVVAANKILQPLAAKYKASTGKLFTSLPAKAQTALFSYAYQNGPGFMNKRSAKQLWQSFLAENWSKAGQTLRNFKKYSGRRRQEAQLLDQIV